MHNYNSANSVVGVGFNCDVIAKSIFNTLILAPFDMEISLN